MARRTFDVIDVTEILVHWHAGRSLNEMSQSLGVDRKTIRKYVAPAAAAGIVPGGPAKAEREWADLVREWFPELSDARLRQVTWPAIAVHHDYITAQLKAGVRMSTIHQRLRDEHGLSASVASFRRYVAANLPEEARRSQVTVWNPYQAEAGEQAQIDYGQLGRWLDPVTGKLRTVWAFVMVLACSRHMFVRPVLKMDQRAWTECHVEAFAFFGGVPARLVPDNLKTGVDKPDLYDPKLNRSYAELAAHYGCLIDPARALKPRDKPQVERPMPYVRDSLWRGREFASLEAMQAEAARWSLEVAGQRACRPLEGAAPAAVFEAVEKDALRPLPAAAPFVLATWATAKIGPDIHAQVDKVLYSVPWRHIGKTADVRITGSMVQFFIGGDLVKSHPRKIRGKQTDFGDYPPVMWNLRPRQAAA
jgi:transposase